MPCQSLLIAQTTVPPRPAACAGLSCRVQSLGSLAPDPTPLHPHCGRGCALGCWWYTWRMTRAVIAVPGIGQGSGVIERRECQGARVQFFASRTEIDITFGVVAELLHAKEYGAMFVIRKGNVGMDVL